MEWLDIPPDFVARSQGEEQRELGGSACVTGKVILMETRKAAWRQPKLERLDVQRTFGGSIIEAFEGPFNVIFFPPRPPGPPSVS